MTGDIKGSATQVDGRIEELETLLLENNATFSNETIKKVDNFRKNVKVS